MKAFIVSLGVVEALGRVCVNYDGRVSRSQVFDIRRLSPERQTSLLLFLLIQGHQQDMQASPKGEQHDHALLSQVWVMMAFVRL